VKNKKENTQSCLKTLVSYDVVIKNRPNKRHRHRQE